MGTGRTAVLPQSKASIGSGQAQATSKDDGAAPIAFDVFWNFNLNFCGRNRRIQGDGPPRHGTPAPTYLQAAKDLTHSCLRRARTQ